jgi:hypothetical protein
MSGFEIVRLQRRVEELTVRVAALEKLTVLGDIDTGLRPSSDTGSLYIPDSSGQSPPAPIYSVEQQTRGWCRVVDAAGNPVNAKAMRRNEAQKYADGLNARPA